MSVRDKQSGSPTASEVVYAFGPFRLRPERHLLLNGDRPVPIGSRALEILIALIEQAGELVTKEYLFSRAWPHSIVEESSLRAQIAALRRVLQDSAESPYIVSIPAHGYRFVAATVRLAVDSGVAEPATRNNLPVRLTPVIGRSEELLLIDARLQRCRLVTVVGPGGVGKTTVAVAAAAQAAGAYRDGVCFLDASALAEAWLLPSILASALGLSVVTEDTTEGLTAQLKGRQILIVLDNCERIVEAAARLAERLLKGAAQVRLLVTCREPLRAEGESVYRLPTLDAPPLEAAMSAADALRYPAVALFVERAAACLTDFRLIDADAAVTADICRQLDGIPLAIELAAGRVDAFGLRGIAQRLEDRFRLLKGGRRSALPRHQTLLATLDWSYDDLSEDEKSVLRALAVFAGGFSFDAAAAVAAPRIAADIVDVMASLVSRSLVSADVDGFLPRYRLLESTRAYALERLEEQGERLVVTRAHALHCRQLFQQALAEWDTREPTEWLQDYAPESDNLRAALDWAYSDQGDSELAIELTIAAIPLWFRLSATDECRECVQRALSRGESVETHERRARQIMQLYAALGLSQAFTVGLSPQAPAAWHKALELAEQLQDREFQRDALWGLWLCQLGDGAYRAALSTAQSFSHLAEAEQDVQMALRLVSVPRHCLGDHASVRGDLERGLDSGATPSSAGVRFRFGQPMAARVILSQMLWLQGYPDQAMAAACRSVEESSAGGHAISHCDALAQALCPIALRIGDYDGAQRSIELLRDITGRHALGSWAILGQCWHGAWLIARGDYGLGVPQLAASLDRLREARFAFYEIQFMSTLAAGIAAQGELPRALAAIDQALVRCDVREEYWYLSEMLRLKGSILALAENASDAERHFRRSLERARAQGALSWELRAATDLAALQVQLGRRDEAHCTVAEVYSRFTEGFATADLVAAQRFLA